MRRERSVLGAGAPARGLLPALRRARAAERGRPRRARLAMELGIRTGPGGSRRGGSCLGGNGYRRGNQEMLQPDAAARVKGGKDHREIESGNALLFNLCSSPSSARALRSHGPRDCGRLGCARLGTGTNSSLPCSGRFSGPVRDSPNGCKGARATSELISRDKGAKRAQRDPSLRGKGVGRVSPPGPACGGASPPGTFSGLAGQNQLGRERGPGGGRSDRQTDR
ncbi:uncharacterized protein LOC135416706 [Pseudopipra pipra]|uniref:uncharacterized protein LOC135416706 n=1 Tax=Pseudopipra pipra TaxID=415032 RepID=UPI003139FE8F